MKKQLSLTRRLALCLALAGFLLPTIVPTASADAITSDETATVTTTVYVGAANGTLTSSKTSSAYYNKWQSTNLPSLTLECSANNMLTPSDTLALYSTDSSCTYNLKAADGWTIKSVSIELKNRYNTEAGTTVTINGGTANTITYTKQTFTATDLSATTVPIVVTKGTAFSTEWSSANWVLISNCSVTLERSTTGRAMTVDMSNGTLNSGTGYSNLWKSTSTDPVYILKASANNMQANGTAIDWYAGSSTSSSYLFSTSSDYAVAGYFLTFKNKAASTSTVTLTANDVSYTVSDSVQTVFVEGLDYPSASLTLAGDNHAVLFSDVKVFLKPRTTTGNATDLFVTDYTSSLLYRIPAIAKTQDGSLLAVSDLRVGSADVGAGQTSLVMRISKDNGETWGSEVSLAVGTGTSGSYDMSYGDAAIVADRESSNVLLICASGYISYGSSTNADPIRVTRLRSSDNGQTWTTTTADDADITDDIYGIFKESTNGVLTKCFFGSGRICQSQVVKVGSYYRLYAALCAEPSGNRVIYSDDFGETWHALGGIDALPAPYGNEPKCEELPDGTVILSSRMSGGRYFNFYTYTDVEKAEGSWGTVATSTSSNNGAYAESHGTNGEILILPATRNSDGKEVYVALQSVPLEGSRTKVGIHYKELSSLDDVKDPATFAANWDGHLQLSSIRSAYSTMIMQPNDSIAFLFEESTYGYDFTIIYRALNLERITSGAYSYKSDVDRATFVRDILKERCENATPTFGTALGMYTPASAVAVSQAGVDVATTVVATYDANPTAQGYADAMQVLSNASSAATEINKPQTGVEYVITSNRLSDYRLALTSTTTTTTDDDGTSTETTTYVYTRVNTDLDDTQKFQFESAGDDVWYIKNTSTGVYMSPSPAASSQFTGTTQKSSAGTYSITSDTDGISYITCTNPTTSSYPCPNVNSGQTQTVAYFASDAGSKWIITPAESSDDATARTALCTVIAATTDYKIGTGLGQFAPTDDFTTALNAATAAAVDYTKTANDLTTATTNLTTAQSALTLNMPTAGMFLRIRTTSENRSAQPYLLSQLATGYTRAGFAQECDENSIFYYTGSNLLGYANGYYLGQTGVYVYFNGVTTPTTVTFSEATTSGTQLNDYYIYYSLSSNSRYLYANLSNGVYYSDAWGDKTTAPKQCNFEIEEVTSLPVTVTAAGYATLYAPVNLTIPDGVKAYTGVVSEDGKYLQLTEVKTTLPANTPVVLEAAAGTYYFTVSAVPTTLSTATSGSDSDILAGNVATFAKTDGDLTLQYIDEIGFYKFTGDNIPGFKSYIESTNAPSVQGLKFADSTTAIDHVTSAPATPADAVYDLQGRRVTNPGRGFYIIGGKKVFRL